MKSLAFKIDKRTYCCACARTLAELSGYPHLFFMVNKPIKVNAEASCHRCGDFYGNSNAINAAGLIADMIKGK